MKVKKSKLSGCLIIEPDVFEDDRGFFQETFSQERYASIGIDSPFIQDNHSRSSKGVLRGLHYQRKKPQGKLVRVVTGSVFDVAVDIRKGSSTYLQWHAEILSEENQRTLYVPDGFAHGFQTLAHNCEVLYCSTTKYMCESEGALNATDPRLNIQWPLSITERSDRDNAHPMITDLFEGVLL